MRPSVLITTLARYQTVFWIPVARKLAELGYKPAFLAFDDPSDRLIRAAGLDSFNAFNLAERAAATSAEELERELQMSLGWTLPLAVSHERITFGVRDTRVLIQKLARHRGAAEKALGQLARERRPIMVVQELGGFLSVIGTFLAARAGGHDNLFLEPSFFKGRFFATRNTFGAPRVARDSWQGRLAPEALEYIAAARATKAIVIPGKDRHHYTAALKKVASLTNARRLMEKLYEKYARGERHEFGYMGAYAANHLRMAANSLRLRSVYAPLEGRLVYYPLHVPADVALTLRAPQYFDQLSLVDYLARIVPASHRVVIKEHPAQVGALDARRLRDLVRRHDNLTLLAPTTNNYEVLAASDLVVSINSKAGAEALLLGKQVLVLGDAFYADSGLVTRVEGLANLPRAIRAALAHPQCPDAADVESFFSAVWRATRPGDLYVSDAANTAAFARSLDAALDTRELVAAASA